MAERLLVLGGRRSGKSSYALERARALGGDQVTFVATARSGDPELDARIAAHRAVRPVAWRTIEVDRDLAAALRDDARALLVDSLTLWASTVIEAERSLRQRWSEAEAVVRSSDAHILFVSEEVGLGITPTNDLARLFADELGWLNQRLAALCAEVRFLVAGIPVAVKGREG